MPLTGAADWIEALREPRCYAHAPPSVEVVQTHISVVCLAGALVFKLKKAVRLPFLDASTLELRLHFCREEVRLNRRLCPDIYLGVVPLHRGPRGLRFGGPLRDTAHHSLAPPAEPPPGPVIDHAVLMVRLPHERMLDQLLRQRAVSRREIEQLARTVAAFHARADHGREVRELGAPERLQGLAHANFTELKALRGHGLPQELLDALEHCTQEDFTRLLPELRDRAAAGRVVDGHGDLHARNVCLTEPAAIYDCIDFAPAFRCGDVATEIAFMVMDLRHRGAPDLARAFARACAEAAGDPGQQRLLPALVAYRAMVRAKVATIAFRDQGLPASDREGARASARRHATLAAIATAEGRGPYWLLVCGPPASGKSALTAHLAAAAGWPVFATDHVRKELAGLAPTGRARPEHYTAAFSDRTYRELIARAGRATAAGEPVVLLDGNFPKPARRSEARATAQGAGARTLCIHVDVDAATAEQRAAARANDPANVSDADAGVARRLRAAFEPPSPAEGFAVLAVDGTQELDLLADQALVRLLAIRS